MNADMEIMVTVDCVQCGRHYEEYSADEIQDVLQRLNETGYCCDWCEEECAA